MKEQITLRLPSKLKDELATEAYEMGYSLNEYILLLIHKANQYRLLSFRELSRNQ